MPVLAGLSPYLRLQSDERLVSLVRRGHVAAFEGLVRRYQPRLLAFCRQMLRSNEDAEDVVQEVFTSAYSAMRADERRIAVRPWLYRIARNRCLNHLRRPRDAGQESMDQFEREAGSTAADAVHGREELRGVLADVHELPDTQRTALLLREVHSLPYEQIAATMDTSVSSVKSLLVRARMSLAEASEARQLTCAEVRLELSQAAEGIAKPSPPARRHARSCSRCRTFRRELRRTSHALHAAYPVGLLAAAKETLGGALVGVTAPGVAGGSATAGGGGALGGTLSVVSASAMTKAAAGLATAALVTAGASEVRHGEPGGQPSAGAAPPPVETAALREDRLTGPHGGRGGDPGYRGGRPATEVRGSRAAANRPDAAARGRRAAGAGSGSRTAPAGGEPVASRPRRTEDAAGATFSVQDGEGRPVDSGAAPESENASEDGAPVAPESGHDEGDAPDGERSPRDGPLRRATRQDR